MQKFFIDDLEYKTLTFSTTHSFQLIRVLRVKVGYKFYVGYNNQTYLAFVNEIKKDLVTFNLQGLVDLNTEFPFNITLFQCLPKGKKLEDIIKHGTELGYQSFVPVMSERVDIKYPHLNYERLRTIALEAAEQSFREIIPNIEPLINLKDLPLSNFSHFLVFYEESEQASDNLKDVFTSISSDSNVAFLIGPEGGFKEQEILFLKEKGALILSLGKRILRTETASLAAISALAYEKELSRDSSC